jgi:hypothetical protein
MGGREFESGGISICSGFGMNWKIVGSRKIQHVQTRFFNNEKAGLVVIILILCARNDTKRNHSDNRKDRLHRSNF